MRGISALLLLLFLLSACEPPPKQFEDRFLAFGTLIDLTIAGTDPATAKRASASIRQSLARMHDEWHAWKPGPLTHLNERLATGDWTDCPPSLCPLLKQAQRLSLRSHNTFNPAIGKLIALWGFHGDEPAPHPFPAADSIAALVRAAPGMTDLAFDGNRIRSRNPALKLDLGAFAKGYGIGQALQQARDLGLRDAILNAGGDLIAIGSRLGQPWRIGVRSPFDDKVVGRLLVKDEAVFTSGGYERNYIHEGKRYHHIIDPATGYPAQGSASVTVIHGDPGTADAAATALFVAGPERWRQVAADMRIDQALMITEDHRLFATAAMAKRLELAPGWRLEPDG